MSTEDFTHDDQPYPETDPSLADFKLNSNHTYNIPILRQISNANRNFRMVGSAWSAPGWMKEGNNVTTRKGILGGTLSSKYVQVYAEYLSKVVQAYTSADLPFDAITM
jgi:glucosylceramidase